MADNENENQQVITQLTPEQEARLPHFRDKWIAIGHSTGRVNRAAAEDALARAYQKAGLAPPPVLYWEDSPLAGLHKATRLFNNLSDDEEPTQQQLMDQLNNVAYGAHDASWLSFYDCFKEFGLKQCEELQPLMDLAKDCGWLWMYDECAVLTEHPDVIHLDEENRLHCEDGPAIRYADGFCRYSWHGFGVEKSVIMDPVTVDRIDNERNAEVRRVLLERMTFEKYMKDSNVEVVHEDRYGKLIRKPNPQGDEPFMGVAVDNSTPEPDGSIRKYILPVPPTMRTAHEAVAWTFEKTPETYNPIVET